jgi:hypothetical protein
MKRMQIAAAAIVGAVVLLTSAVAGAAEFSAWGPWASIETLPGSSSDVNTPYLDGCPIQAPNGLSLYMASTRPGGVGGIDIWVATRPSKGVGFGAPQNLGAPVNSPADDFCPTPLPGGHLFFVSSRGGGCGGADMYATKRTRSGWQEPRNLGCQVNSGAGELSPSLVKEGGTSVLYFSSNRPGGFAPETTGPADSDIYRSVIQGDGTFGPAALVPGVNTTSEDARPNLRKDALEMVFDSDRPGTLGGPDIHSAVRSSVSDEWATPTNLSTINSPASDTRASLSWDGRMLLFGSNRGGSELDPATGAPSNDIYFTTRQVV